MKTALKVLLGLVVVLAAYLLFWPVPVSPQKWEAPTDLGFSGEFEPNTRLSAIERIPLPEGYHGPEDVVIAQEDGREIAYTTSQDGVILRVDTAAGTSTVFAETGGVPLGMERDADGNFIVADAFRGLLWVSADGTVVTVLTDEVDGSPILYADDLDIGPNGVIYFSDASTKFGAEAIGSTMAASLLEIGEQGRTGRFLSFDPRTGETAIVADGYSFANGVAMCASGDCILVAETGRYKIDKIYVSGPRTGQVETIIDSLPGFPDNINRGGLVDGKPTFWVGFASPRSAQLDALDDQPFLRSVMYRLPAFLRPAPTYYSIVFQIDEDGNVLQTLQDPAGSYPITTGAIEGDGWLYITSLEAHDLGRVRYPQ